MAKKTGTQNITGVWMGLAITRILLGFVFLWAFADKLIGLGVSTPADRAWLGGGSPTTGFLKGVEGPFSGFFNSLAGSGWADWLFMLGLLAIGLALVLGVAMRLAAWSGALLMLMMWAASLPLENNPVVDEHIVYAVVLLTLGVLSDQHMFSLSGWWQSQSFVKNNAWLR